MATKKKMLQAAAGQAGGAGLDITDVFSTYLYTGNGSTQTITNDIDLAGEGGLVWTKSRETGYSHELIDTERGIKKTLRSNGTDAEGTVSSSAGFSSFNSNGYSIAGQFGTWGSLNVNNEDHVSWTFRKAPKFFDVVTYTGDGNASKTISHSLGSTPGFFVCKPLNQTGGWRCFHRSTGNDAYGQLNENYEFSLSDNIEAWAQTSPTDTNFTVGISNNTNNINYVAYLFAHNDGDGEFGPDGDQDIIKCGTYTAASNGVEINLGFEPQWVMFKRADSTGGWKIIDVMRGFTVSDNPASLEPNTSDAEGGVGKYRITNTGFRWNSDQYDTGDYIYMAIRRGPLAQPESGTEVFAAHKETTSNLNQNPPFLQPAPFAVDFISNKLFGGSSSWWSATRLTNARLQFESTAAETSVSTTHEFDHNDGVAVNGLTGATNFMGYMWKRAPGFFDVVTYTGNDTARTIQHNLGAVPEMIWVKSRSATTNWSVLHSGLNTAGNEYIRLNLPNAKDSNVQIWNGTVPTDTVFSVGASDQVNHSYLSATYIAYLFATVPGVSKVGSYTGNGSSQTIDCGFTSGARFVLIKRTDTTGNWFVLDTARGIVSGNDPLLELNSTGAEDNQYDNLDPYSAGFTVTAYGGTSPYLNISGGTYIFYAIA